MEADRGVAGEGEGDIAARVLTRLEVDGEQRQHPIGSRRSERLDLGAENPVETKRRPAPLILVGGGLGRLLPVEAVENGGKALLRGEVGHLAYPHHSILQVRRHDLEVLFVERNQSELGVGHRGIQASSEATCGLRQSSPLGPSMLADEAKPAKWPKPRPSSKAARYVRRSAGASPRCARSHGRGDRRGRSWFRP